MPLLSIQDLSIRFGSASAHPVVESLSLDIAPGESLGLVGESGSGKSVTSLAILRLLGAAAHTSGAIYFQTAGSGDGGAADGHAHRHTHGQASRGTVSSEPVNLLTLAAEPMRRLRGSAIGMIFQEPMTSLNPVMPVGEQIAEAIRAHHPDQNRRQVRASVLEAMAAVALPDPMRRLVDYPHQFSGGQRQRLLIAMAIVNRPRLLIADEPTTALDVTVQAQILELLQSLREQYGLAMLFISHDLAVVSQVADRVAVMRHGVLLEQGPAQAIFRTPLHAYTRSLLGAIPTMSTPVGQPLAMVDAAPDPVSIAGLAGAPGQLREATPGHWVRG